MLPARSQAAYMDKLVIRGLDPFKMKGEESFNALAATVVMHFKISFAQESVANNDKNSQPTKTSKQDKPITIHHQGPTQSTLPTRDRPSDWTTKPDKDNVHRRIDFPCPLAPGETMIMNLGNAPNSSKFNHTCVDYTLDYESSLPA